MNTAEPTSSAPSITTLESTLLRSYLLNVADAIENVLSPELSGAVKARAGECIVILGRAAQSLDGGGAEVAELLAKLDAHTAPVSAGVWKDAAAAEGAVLDRVEANANTGRKSTVATSSRTFSGEKFERYLRLHPSGGPQIKVAECKQLPGGRSKQTILVTLENAHALPAHVVVRMDWASAVTGTSVVSEFALLRRVFEAGLRVPQPLLLEKSGEPLGAPFLIVTRMAGGPKGDIFNPPPSEALALEVADQLARLHRLPAEEFSALEVPTEAFSVEQLRAGLQGFRAMNAQLGLPSRTIEIAMDWLEKNVDRVTGARALVHNDLGCHNFLIEGEHLTAILDWELAHVGNPAADLGYIRSWIGKMTSWPRFIEAYRAAGGLPVDELTLDFYTLWCGVRLYCLLLQARAGVAMGLVKDTEITYAVAEFLPMLLHRISCELRAVLKNEQL